MWRRRRCYGVLIVLRMTTPVSRRRTRARHARSTQRHRSIVNPYSDRWTGVVRRRAQRNGSAGTPAHTRIRIPWPNDFADGFALPARGARRPRRTQGLPPRRPQRPQSMRRRTTMCAAKIGVARDVVSPRDPPTHSLALVSPHGLYTAVNGDAQGLGLARTC